MSKVIRHIDTPAVDIRPFALVEAGVQAGPQRTWQSLTTKIIRATEAASLSIHTFPLLESPASTRAAEAVTPTEEPEASARMAADEDGGTAATPESNEPLPPTPDMLLQQARDEAERYLAEARERAAAVEADGYNVGLKQGEAAALAAMQAQFAFVFNSLQTATDECARLRHNVLQQAEDDIVTLAFHLARKIIQHEPLCNPAILTTSLRRALAHVMDREQVVVRVNPTELEGARQLKDDFLHTIQGLRHLSIEGDEAVGPGGCVVESTFGEIEARLEAQVEELEERFREHYSLMSEARDT